MIEKRGLGNKKGAIELSMGTIIIIVLGVTMLILGMVLVRSVMCSALSLTGDVNKKISSELDKYFEEKGDEVVCIGESNEASMVPGSKNFVWCSIKAPAEAEYTVTLKDYSPIGSGLTKATLTNWIKDKDKSWTVTPGDQKPKAALILDVPKNAPEASLRLSFEVTKKVKGETETSFVSSIESYFKVTRIGFIKSTMC